VVPSLLTFFYLTFQIGSLQSNLGGLQQGFAIPNMQGLGAAILLLITAEGAKTVEGGRVKPGHLKRDRGLMSEMVFLDR